MSDLHQLLEKYRTERNLLIAERDAAIVERDAFKAALKEERDFTDHLAHERDVKMQQWNQTLPPIPPPAEDSCNEVKEEYAARMSGEPATGGEKAGDVASAPSVDAKAAAPSPLPDYSSIWKGKWFVDGPKTNNGLCDVRTAYVNGFCGHICGNVVESIAKEIAADHNTKLDLPTLDPDRGKVVYDMMFPNQKSSWHEHHESSKQAYNSIYDAVIAHREGKQ